MPVEIKELVIRAVVEPCDPRGEDTQPAHDSGSTITSADPRDLVQASVRQVLKILRRSKER